MHAVTIDAERLVWREHADPRPGSHDLLVEVRAAGLNAADVLQAHGGYRAPEGSPQDIPGLEAAGVVVAVGPRVTRFAIGDRVMSLTWGGGQAELVVVPERVALPVPDALSWAEAGGFTETFATAHDALFTRCGLQSGERLLVHGAAGGVGTAAVQLGAAAGAEIVATVRDPRLRPMVAALGEPFGAEIRAVDPEGFADDGPFDVVLELVGGTNLAANVDALATGGRIVMIAIASGRHAEIDLGMLMIKRGSVHGSQMRTRSAEERALVARGVERHVLPLLRTGRLRVPVFAEHPMSEPAGAYERFEAGGKLGKIVLVG